MGRLFLVTFGLVCMCTLFQAKESPPEDDTPETDGDDAAGPADSDDQPENDGADEKTRKMPNLRRPGNQTENRIPLETLVVGGEVDEEEPTSSTMNTTTKEKQDKPMPRPTPRPIRWNKDEDETRPEVTSRPVSRLRTPRPLPQPMPRPIGSNKDDHDETRPEVDRRPITRPYPPKGDIDEDNKKEAKPQARPITARGDNANRESNGTIIGQTRAGFFKIANEVFVNEIVSKAFPPKLRRVEDERMADFISSFKEEHLRNLVKQMLPRKFHSEDSESADIGGTDDTGFNFTHLPESHIRRLVHEIGGLPADLQNKIIGAEKLEELTVEEILQKFPVNIFPCFTRKKYEEVKQLDPSKLSAICQRLLKVSSSPWNLDAALSAGVNCLDTIRTLNISKKFLSNSQAQVLMKHLRATGPSPPWTYQIDPSFLTKVGSALTPEEILSVPSNFFMESLPTISKIKLPHKSQRRAFMRKIQEEYGTPDFWPESVLEDLGDFIDDMDMSQIAMLDEDNVLKIADTMSQKVKSTEKRFAIAEYLGLLQNTWENRMTTRNIRREFPWVKSDKSFLKSLNLTNFLEALNSTHSLTSNLLPGEVSYLATRLRVILDPANLTYHDIDSLGEILDGFDTEFFETIPKEAIVNSSAISHVHFKSKAKVRAILKRRRHKQVLPTRIANLFRGFRSDDIDKLDPEQLVSALNDVDDFDIDQSNARRMINKIVNRIKQTNETAGACSSPSVRALTKLTRHIPTQMLVEHKLFDPFHIASQSIGIDTDCLKERKFTKAQYYALFEILKEQFGEIGADNPTYIGEFFDNIGSIVLGMTGEDINNLPEDTELLTIIDILSKYEDEMDSSQIEAIVRKICQYFDIYSRNELEEITPTSINQIGRFLQYLSVDTDLHKLPKHLHSLMGKLMGQSKMNKISLNKRNQLLKFVLKNKGTVDGLTEDGAVTDTLNELMIEDLGFLKCGMGIEEIARLTDQAIEENIEELQACPFKLAEAQALTRRTIRLNRNRLKACKYLIGMAALLPFVPAEEMYTINQDSLSTLAEYIVQLIGSREQEIEIRKMNGFITEWSTDNHNESAHATKELLTKIYYSLMSVDDPFTQESCFTLRSMGGNFIHTNMSSLNTDDQLPCNEDFGNLPSVNRHDARWHLKSMMSHRGKSNLIELAKSLTPEDLEQNAALIKALTPHEMRQLNVNDSVAMGALGKHSGYSPKQCRAGFEVWKNQKGSHKISVDDVLILDNFVCGATAQTMRSLIDSKTVMDTIDSLGRLKICDSEQLHVLAAKLLHRDAFGPNIKHWKPYQIAAAGHVLGGLRGIQLSKLTTNQIHAISPEIITYMPDNKIKDFTTDQLASFTANQKNAITTTQRSYMTENQMNAIVGTAYGTTGGQNANSDTRITWMIFVNMVIFFGVVI